MSQFYDNADVISYEFEITDMSATTVAHRQIGPAGKKGRLVSFTSVEGTGSGGGVTIAAPTATTLGTVTIPSVVGANGAVSATRDELKAFSDFPVDTRFQIAPDGTGAAGSMNINMAIAWF